MLNPAKASAPEAARNPPAPAEPAQFGALRRGDPEAFRAMYAANRIHVYRFLYRRVWHVQTAEDLCSETFLRAWQRIDGYRWQGCEIRAWLLTIARNLTIDHHRRPEQRAEVTVSELPEAVEPAVPFEHAIVDDLEYVALRAAIESLREDQRVCLSLRFEHGLTMKETATLMGRGEQAAKMLQHRGLRALARYLSAEDSTAGLPAPAGFDGQSKT